MHPIHLARALAIPTALLAALATSNSAHASFVATSAQSFISVANAALQYGYNIDSFGRLTSSGFASSGGCSGSCNASGSGSTDTTGMLTSSFDQTQMASDNLSHDGTQLIHTTATASARADLASASVGVYGGGTHLDVLGTGGQDGGTGTSAAIANDMLHFSVANASSATLSYIGVTYTIDGSIGYAGAGVEASAIVEPRLFLGNANFYAAIEANGNLAPSVTQNTAANWVSYGIAPDTPGQIVFHGVYALTGSQVDIGVQEGLNAQCGGGDTCDYAHTATLSFALPSNVSFTSDSGVFLTAPVPEPASAELIAAGLGMLGFLCRRRARRIDIE